MILARTIAGRRVHGYAIPVIGTAAQGQGVEVGRELGGVARAELEDGITSADVEHLVYLVEGDGVAIVPGTERVHPGADLRLLCS